MASRQPSKFIRHVGALCLEQLREAEWVKAEEFEAPCALVTTRRALAWLKEQLGEDGLWAGPDGYSLRDREFELDDRLVKADKPVVIERVVEKVVERIVEVPSFAGDLKLVSTKALMDELVRRGWVLDARKRFAA